MLSRRFRPATSEPGHHQPLIQALPKTAGVAVERVPILDAYRKARNLSDYGGGEVSDAVASECAQEAGRLIVEVRVALRGS